MNKITVTKEEYIELKDNAVDLDINVPKLTINVKGKVLVNELSIKDNENTELTINVEPQSSLVYNRFLVHNIIFRIGRNGIKLVYLFGHLVKIDITA